MGNKNLPCISGVVDGMKFSGERNLTEHGHLVMFRMYVDHLLGNLFVLVSKTLKHFHADLGKISSLTSTVFH